MPKELRVTDQNVAGFKTIYDDFQLNPAYFQQHARSDEFLAAVGLYEKYLEEQKPPEPAPHKTPDRFLPDFMQPEPRQDIYRMGEGLKATQPAQTDLPLDQSREHVMIAGKPLYSKRAMSIQAMRGYQPGEVIEPEEGELPVKARKLNGLQKAVNSYVNGAYDIVDLAGGAANWVGFEETGQRIRDFAKEVKADYRVPELEKTFTWSDMADPTFYYTKGLRMIPLLTTIIPTAFAGGGIGGGIATGLGASRGVATVVAAVSSAVASRPIESGMEAIGTYNEMIDAGETRETAGKAASQVFLQNLALIGMDAAQYALAFAKIPAPLRKGMAEWIKRSGIKAIGFAAAAASEGYEEVIQNYFQEFGKASARGEMGVEELKSLLLATPEAKEAFVLGTMAGVGFQAAGQISGTDETRGKLSEEELNKLIEEQIIILEVNDGAEPADVKEKMIVDALNVGLEKSGLGITETPIKPEVKADEEKPIKPIEKKPAAVEADIEAKPISTETPAVAEAEKEIEPTKPIKPVVEKPKPVKETPKKATLDNLDQFLDKKIAGNVIFEKTDEKSGGYKELSYHLWDTEKLEGQVFHYDEVDEAGKLKFEPSKQDAVDAINKLMEEKPPKKPEEAEKPILTKKENATSLTGISKNIEKVKEEIKKLEVLPFSKDANVRLRRSNKIDDLVKENDRLEEEANKYRGHKFQVYDALSKGEETYDTVFEDYPEYAEEFKPKKEPPKTPKKVEEPKKPVKAPKKAETVEKSKLDRQKAALASGDVTPYQVSRARSAASTAVHETKKQIRAITKMIPVNILGVNEKDASLLTDDMIRAELRESEITGEDVPRTVEGVREFLTDLNELSESLVEYEARDAALLETKKDKAAIKVLKKYPELIPVAREIDIPKLVAGMGPPGPVESRLTQKKFFTDIYEDIEKQINNSLEVIGRKDTFYDNKGLSFIDMEGYKPLESGENFTVSDKGITIKTERGKFQFRVPKNIAELQDFRKSINLMFKPAEKPYKTSGPSKRSPILKALRTVADPTASDADVKKADQLLQSEGIGYTKPVKIDFAGSKSKKIIEKEERLAKMAISGGMEGTLPTIVQDYSGEFEMTELTKFERFRAFIEDSNTRIHTLNNNIEVVAGTELDENLDLYAQKDMLSRKESDAVRRVRNEKRAYAIDLTEKGLDVDEVGQLAVAEHAFERNRIMNVRRVEINKEPIEGLSGMTDEQAQAIIDKATPEMLAETEKLRGLYDELLTESVELGLTTEKIAEAYRKTYDNYVALFRDIESDNISGIGTGQGVDIRGQESKRAKGSLKSVHNPIANYFYSRERLIVRALKNDIGVTMAQMVNEYPFLEDLFEIRKTPMRPAGKVAHKAAYDAEFQDALLDFAFKVGLKDFKTEGQVGRVLGYYVRGRKKIVKKLGAGEKVLAHETGHFISEILGAKYNFKQQFYRNRKISKALGQEIHDHSARQGETGKRLASVEEKWANAFGWWMTHRGQAKTDMPLFDTRIREIIAKNKELRPLLNIRPTPSLGVEQILQDIFVEYFPLGPNEIGFKSEGKQYFIKVKDDALAVALKDINLARIGKGVRTARIALAVWSSFKTKYRPEFLITNFERDLGEALINLGVERHLLGDKGKGLRRAVVKDLFPSQREIYKYMREAHDKAEAPAGHEAVDEFFRLGGDVGKYWVQDIGKTEKTLRQIQDEITGEGINVLMNPVRKAEQLIDAVQSAVELGIRFSTYKELVNRGMSKPKAIQAVADLTVNFSRQGNIGPVLKSLYGFIGPAIQGTSKIARVMATPYGRKYKSKMFAAKIGGAAASLAVLGFTVRMLSTMMDPDGDEEMNDFTKNHKIAFSYNGKTYSLWNMPYGYTSFYSIGNNMAEIALGRKTTKEALAGVLETSVNAFSPWGTNLNDFVPTLAKPIFEINANEGWYDGDVYPEQVFTLTPKPDHETYFKNARKSAIFATKILYNTTGIDIHPNALQYGFSQWGGGPFEFVLDTYESAARGLNGEFNPNRTPFVRQFYREGSPDNWSYGVIYDTLEQAYKREMSPMEKNRFYRAINIGIEEEFFGDTEKERILKGNGFIQKFIKAQYKMSGGIFLPENLIKLDQMPGNDKNRLIATYAAPTRKRLQKVVINY